MRAGRWASGCKFYFGPLYAFNAAPVSGTLPFLGQRLAKIWKEPDDADIVPVVSNGKVCVASSGGAGAGTLTIFGFGP